MNLVTDLGESFKGNLKVPSTIGRVATYTDFDHSFLAINYQQANVMDKIHKSFLQYGYECIMDAGISPLDIKGRNIAVYLHSTLSDDEMRNATNSDNGETRYRTPLLVGLARTMFANRISAYFDLHGPSVSHQGAFENAFTTLKLAFEDVASGKVESAIVGVSNLCVNPQPSVQLQGMNLLTKDSDCRPLDENGNGFIRADSTVVFFLQAESEAKKNYGEIVGIASVYQGNRLGNFVSRDEKFIQKVLEEFYRNNKFNPNDISYLETGSWAIKNLDSQELKIIEKVFLQERNENDPLLIGSVLGNMGFSEGAAAFVSIVKCLIALGTGVIPPTVKVQNPNSAAIGSKIKIVTEKTPCKDYVAVNMFGVSGGFSHCVIKKPENKIPINKLGQDDFPRLYIMAARDSSHTAKQFQKLKDIVPDKYLAASLCDVFRKDIRGYTARSFAIYPTKKDKNQLVKDYQGDVRPVWFLFSGMGSQWQAMGKDLMKFPVFAEVIEECHEVLKRHDMDLKYILTNEEDKSIFENIINSFVGIASIQMGLVNLLRAIGVKPDGMIGHSVGELGCAYADECLTVEQVILAALARGQASMRAELVPGMMAAIGLGHSDILPFLPPDVQVACHNSAQSCTLSGPTESVKLFVDQLTEKGIFAKAVNVSNIAYHSKYIQPAGPLLLELLKDVIPSPKERSSKWICTSIPEVNWKTEIAQHASAEYFTNNLLSAVYFEEGAHHIPKDAILVEIAPHGLLQPIVKKSLDTSITNIALTNRSKSADNIEYLLEGIGQMYLNGCDVNVNAIYPTLHYPMPPCVPSLAQFATWDFSLSSNAILESGAASVWSKDIVLGLCSSPKYQHLLSHKIADKFAMPIAVYIELIYKLFMKKNPASKKVVFENIKTYDVDNTVFLKDKVEVCIAITKFVGNFEVQMVQRVYYAKEEVVETPVLVMTGNIRAVDESMPEPPDWQTEIGTLDFKAYLNNLKYSIPERQCLSHLTKYFEGLTGQIESKGHLFDLLDTALKLFIIEKSGYKTPHVPFSVQKILLDVDVIESYVKGAGVQVYYDLMTNRLTSTAIFINRVKTKPYELDDNPAPADYTGPLEYFSKMKYVSLEDIDIQYVGLSSQMSVQDNTIIDYSGITHSGAKIIGVVSYVNSQIKLDKNLVWDIPISWNLEKAVTIPLAYSMAYFCLVKKKAAWRDRKSRTILVHCGDTAVGEACISVALALGKVVFTTVATDEGYDILRKRFPQIPAKNIFFHKRRDYHANLMLDSNGKGVDVVINMLRDEEHMNTALLCIGEINGELIQIGVHEESRLQTYQFLRSHSFISLNANAIADSSDDIKQQIHDFIRDGIKAGFVKPIEATSCVTTPDQNVSAKLQETEYCVVPLNSRQNYKTPVLNVNPESSYVLIGGKGTYELCEWLMEKGAKKILIEFSHEFRASQMSHLLEKYGSIIMVSRSNSSTLAGTRALLGDARGMGDVAAIFAVNLRGEDCLAKLQNIKEVCREQKNSILLSNLLCSEVAGWDFEIRGYNSKTISSILPELDKSLKTSYTVPVSSGKDISDVSTQRSSRTQYQTLLDAHLIFPLEESMKKIESTETTPIFVEQRSLSLPKIKVFDVQPIFFLPAINFSNIKKMLKNIIYPSFLAQIPVGCSMEDVVKHLYKSLKEIQPKGTYTLVSESWSGIFALKLGEFMEQRGETIQYVFLDSSPHLLKDVVQLNQQVFSNTNNLASYILRNDENVDSQKKAKVEKCCEIILDRVRHNVESEIKNQIKGDCCIVTSKYSNFNIRDQYKMFKSITATYSTNFTSPYEFSTDKMVTRFINEHNGHVYW